MSQLDGYKDTLVIQCNRETGCIPSGIEWMARHMGVSDASFDYFQEEFDLASRGIEPNGFGNVPTAVAAKYERVQTAPIGFPDANDKIACIADCIGRGIPCLISLWQGNGSFHIVPVVATDETSITVLWMDGETIEDQTRSITHDNIRQWHSAVEGGHDILVWGEAPGVPQ